ncbi:hypothetical protein NCCP2716_10030 [Sporosarcina sp. NCCP-2716]|uniref:DUF4003 family protein n=1 Tax=Sporosarcina sp. NCCP-2716 TaxID=2943679 RepID=UPI00203B611B|nr:DUF4003 family protein [Sporosarcina sp. NCCP-2716]GKV68505.1 hypothetical protein NCCP2716_10030 [Sporosarcina sp. NCCP-2716]
MEWNTVNAEITWTHEKVTSLAGWSVDEKDVLTTAVYYVLAQHDFDAESFSRTMDALKKRVGWLSPVRGNFLPLLASFLDTGRLPADEAVDGLFKRQQVLRRAGFKNTVHSFLAALLMSPTPGSFQSEAVQAKRLYTAMKKQHFLLTSDEDYSYAMLLGKLKNDPKEQAALMRKYYDELNGSGFKSGAELQWLSQVLTIDCCSYKEEHAVRSRELMTHIRKRVNLKPIHYPLIGFLAILECSDDQVEQLISLTNFLAKEELFKLRRAAAFSFGTGYLLQQLMERGEFAEIPRPTLFIIRQAVMGASVASIVSGSTAALP